MELNDWLTILGALGGLEAIKWMVNFYVIGRLTQGKRMQRQMRQRMRMNVIKLPGWRNVLLNGMRRLMLFMLNFERSNLLIWKIYIKDMWQNCNLKKQN